MCGILVHKGTYGDLSKLSRRGPDGLNTLTSNGFTFVHFLLSITGEYTLQPFENDNIICLYNGEIYNQPFEGSDGECLIPLYEEYGFDFIKHLDGEFAIALYDFRKNKVLFATDSFSTKPIWITPDLECASYRSALNGKATKVKANRGLVFDLQSKKQIQKIETHTFDFANQTKNSYEDCIQAFEGAVDKRAVNGCFIGLSSGYDSGAIAARLNLLDVDWKGFSILGKETKTVLDERLRLVPGELINYTRVDYERTQKFAQQNAEPYTYNFVLKGKNVSREMLSDNAVPGLSAICERARTENRKVYLSGQGADEIIGDYILYQTSSCFKGMWPEVLGPWINFYGGIQDGFINKEENIAGAYGVETRYPFLDPRVVQEWLWLSVQKKKEQYKGPIRKYLEDRNFPFAPEIKIGFKSKENLFKC